MFIRKSKLALAIASMACLGAPASAYATNGYFAHGYGTKSKAMGGAGVALSQDSMAAATNPAGMVRVGSRYDIGVEFFAPHREYSISGNSFSGMNNDQSSDLDYFFVPHMAANWMVGESSSVGITVYGNGGMNTKYKEPVFGFFGGSAPTGVDLMQLFIAMTYSQKVTSGFSVGASVIPVVQRFEASGLEPFQSISSDMANVSNNQGDASTGIGYRVGVQWEVGGGVTLGAAYQPEINMGRFDQYAGLFADKGNFDIPSTYTVGAAWKMTPNWSLLLDYQRINYEDVRSVSNPSFVPPPFGPSGAKLGEEAGPGFGWSSIDVFKLGIQYTTGDWAWRAGWNHGDCPIENEGVELMFNILAPGVITDHLTLGFTKLVSQTTEVTFGYTYSFRNEVSGNIPSSVSTFGGGDISIAMYQNSAELSIGVKF